MMFVILEMKKERLGKAKEKQKEVIDLLLYVMFLF